MWGIWLVIAIIFAIAEMAYSGFFLIWFSTGAVIALFVSLITSNLLIQSCAFLFTSVILLLTLTKYFTKKFSSTSFATNTDGLIGKTAIVTERIGSTELETGLVKLDGEIWTAVSSQGQVLEKGTLVKVEAIKGVRLIVVHA